MALRGDGHVVFLDDTDLPPANTFHERIRQAIEDADLMVFLVSPSSVHPKRYTLSELKFARDKWPHPRNCVLPVMVATTPMQDVPPYLKAVSIMTPKGDLAAEVSYEVERLNRANRGNKPASFVSDTGDGGPSWLMPADGGPSPRPSVILPPLLLSVLLFALVGLVTGLIGALILELMQVHSVYNLTATMARALIFSIIFVAVPFFFEVANARTASICMVSVWVGFLASLGLAWIVSGGEPTKLEPIPAMFIGSARVIVVALGVSLAYRELFDNKIVGAVIFAVIAGGFAEVTLQNHTWHILTLPLSEALAAAMLCYIIGSIAYARQERGRRTGPAVAYGEAAAKVGLRGRRDTA